VLSTIIILFGISSSIFMLEIQSNKKRKMDVEKRLSENICSLCYTSFHVVDIICIPPAGAIVIAYSTKKRWSQDNKMAILENS